MLVTGQDVNIRKHAELDGEMKFVVLFVLHTHTHTLYRRFMDVCGQTSLMVITWSTTDCLSVWTNRSSSKQRS